MIGNAQEGVHNLRIENVQMEDDGEYQCQVRLDQSANGHCK
jgi:immunoglobulin I-set domain